jgi:hypothetical protein
LREFRTLVVPGVTGGFLRFTEHPAPHGYSPAEDDFCGSAVLCTPQRSLGTGLCLTRADQLDLLYFLDAPSHVTGGYPVHSRYASPCNELRLALTVERTHRHSYSLAVEVTNRRGGKTQELTGELLVPLGAATGETVASFFPGISTDDLDLDAPDGEHLDLVGEILDRWPCRALVERRAVDGVFLYGSLIQPVARRLYQDASEEELTAYLQARVAEARGEAGAARERAVARELLECHAKWRRDRAERARENRRKWLLEKTRDKGEERGD